MREILSFLVIGFLAGLIASLITRGRGLGFIGDIFVGIIGAFFGGFILGLVGLTAHGFMGGLISATVGAVVFLAFVKIIKRI